MRSLILTVLLLVLAPMASADDKNDAEAKLHEYFELFSAKDIEQIANYIYSTPVHIGGGETHRVLADPAAAEANLSSLYGQIEAQGWVESRISDLKTCVLTKSLALVDTRYSRLRADGTAIEPAIRTTLYVVQKIDSEWRIVAFYGHSSDNRPAC